VSRNDLLRLLFDGQQVDQGSNFFSGLPFCKLSKTLLARPDTGMNDLQKQLARSRVKYKDSTVWKKVFETFNTIILRGTLTDRLGGQVTLKCLVDGDTVDIGVIHEPYELINIQLMLYIYMDWGAYI